MSRRSKAVAKGTQHGAEPTNGVSTIQMGGHLLLVLMGVLQLVAIVQSESPADTVLHGTFLLVLIVLGTRKANSLKNLHGKN